jgi:hypothetical protein
MLRSFCWSLKKDALGTITDFAERRGTVSRRIATLPSSQGIPRRLHQLPKSPMGLQLFRLGLANGRSHVRPTDPDSLIPARILRAIRGVGQQG